MLYGGRSNGEWYRYEEGVDTLTNKNPSRPQYVSCQYP